MPSDARSKPRHDRKDAKRQGSQLIRRYFDALSQHAVSPGDYGSIVRWIEANGIPDDHGGFVVPDGVKWTQLFNAAFPKPDSFFHAAAIGTPAYHVKLAWDLMTHDKTKSWDDVPGLAGGAWYWRVPDKALRQLRLAAGGGPEHQAQAGNGGLDDPIPVVKIVEVVGRKAGRSDKLAAKMKRRGYPLKKMARKWHCQRKDAIAMFSRFAERIKKI